MPIHQRIIWPSLSWDSLFWQTATEWC